MAKDADFEREVEKRVSERLRADRKKQDQLNRKRDAEFDRLSKQRDRDMRKHLDDQAAQFKKQLDKQGSDYEKQLSKQKDDFERQRQMEEKQRKNHERVQRKNEQRAQEAQRKAEQRARRNKDKLDEASAQRSTNESDNNQFLSEAKDNLNKKRQERKAALDDGQGEDVNVSGKVTQNSKTDFSSDVEDNDKHVAADELDDFDDNEDDDSTRQTWVEKIADLDLKKLAMYLVPALILLMVLYYLGFSSGVSKGKSMHQETRVADSVEGSYGVLEDVESMKDAQIRSLRGDIEALREQDGGSSSTRLSADEAVGIEDRNADIAKTLDPFFDGVLRINRNASSSEMTSHQNNLKEYVTDSAATSTLYEFLSGDSPARQLGEDVRKSGTTMTFWASTEPGGSVTYFAVVPLVAESGTAKATYTVTVDAESKKIDNITYNGILNDGDAEFVEESLADHKDAASQHMAKKDKKSSHKSTSGKGNPPAESNTDHTGGNDDNQGNQGNPPADVDRGGHDSGGREGAGTDTRTGVEDTWSKDEADPSAGWMPTVPEP